MSTNKEQKADNKKKSKKRRGGRIYQLKKLKRLSRQREAQQARPSTSSEGVSTTTTASANNINSDPPDVAADPGPSPTIQGFRIKTTKSSTGPRIVSVETIRGTATLQPSITIEPEPGTSSKPDNLVAAAPSTAVDEGICLLEWKLSSIDLSPDILTTWVPPRTIPRRDPRRPTYMRRRADLLYRLYGTGAAEYNPAGGLTPPDSPEANFDGPLPERPIIIQLD